MNSDGSDQSRLTSNPANDYAPSFSPDGEKIVFTSGRDSYYKIYLMNADGTDQTRLTDNAANDFQPAFSADGEKVTFVSDRDGNQEIYAMNRDGSDQIRLTNDAAYDYLPDWQPLSEPALPTSQAECKTGGYQKLGFKNQGSCIAWVQGALRSR
jgi:Tol biopolymer transport system component